MVTAWTMLVSLSTGQPLALLNASELTVERTAATTVLAADLLLPPGARTAAVIGYGR
ncbi:ornithine cyclodeaminase, partial [Streptomyces sp. NPDC004237]